MLHEHYGNRKCCCPLRKERRQGVWTTGRNADCHNIDADSRSTAGEGREQSGRLRSFRLTRACSRSLTPDARLRWSRDLCPQRPPTERFNFWNEIISNPLQPSCDAPHIG